jgi:hypothetical protein
MMKIAYTAVLLAAFTFPAAGEDARWKLGLFEAAINVGENPRAGFTQFDAAHNTYRITGGGANIWNKVDAFQYVWRRLSGDAALSADVEFLGTSAAGHRKAVLMFRQSLDPDAAYADIAVHGDGMIALQSRVSKAEITTHIVSPAKGRHVRIERHGDQFTLYVGQETTGPVTVALRDPVYIGIGVSAHDATQLETAVFSNVSIEPLTTPSQRPAARSKISVYDLATKTVKVVYTADAIFEAPNWSPNGKFLLTNSDGKLYRLPVAGGQPEKIDLGEVDNINNDHGLSPDGKTLVVSARLNGAPPKLYIGSADGNNRRQLTPEGPSYFHGWSPDGKWMVFTGQRNANFDLYRISANGEQARLTAHPAYDDGPDYSPDGKWIYFNSERSGSGDIWRIPSEGGGADDVKAQQVTTDEMEDWFPHPSPDGKWLLFLSFPKGTLGHPPNLNVQLRMMALPGEQLGPGKIETLVKLFGGQGTINVNSWSPDSKRFAFVSYELPAR